MKQCLWDNHPGFCHVITAKLNPDFKKIFKLRILYLAQQNICLIAAFFCDYSGGMTNPDSEGFKLSFPLVPNFVTNPSQCFPHPFSLWHQLHWNIYVVTQSLCNLFSAIQNKYTKFKLKFNQTPENGRNVTFSSNATQNNKYRETVTNCEWMYVNSCVTTAWTGGTAWKSVCSQNHKNLL